MSTNTRNQQLSFGEPDTLASSFSSLSRKLKGSQILQIAGEVREKIAAGEQILNLTVGDFNPAMFPIPDGMKERIKVALDAGETIYPPANPQTGHALIVDKNFVEMMAMLLLVALPAGRVAGLDFFLYNFFGKKIEARYCNKVTDAAPKAEPAKKK